MGLMDFLFGGTKTSENKTSTSYDPRVGRLQGMGEDLYRQIATRGFEGYNPADRVAGFDPRLMQRLNGVYGGAADLGGMGFGLLGQAAGMDPTDASGFMNPFQRNVMDAANAQFDESLNRGFNSLNSRFGAQRAFGNSRTGLAFGQMAGDLGRARADSLSQLGYQGYMDSLNRQRQRQMDMFGMGSGLAGLGFQGAQGLMGVGDYQRNIQQQGANARYEEFMRRQNDPYQRLGALGAALQGPWGMTQTGKTTEKDSRGGLIGNVIGAGTQIAGLLGGGAAGGVGATQGPNGQVPGVPMPQLPSYNLNYGSGFGLSAPYSSQMPFQMPTFSFSQRGF